MDLCQITPAEFLVRSVSRTIGGPTISIKGMGLNVDVLRPIIAAT